MSIQMFSIQISRIVYWFKSTIYNVLVVCHVTTYAWQSIVVYYAVDGNIQKESVRLFEIGTLNRKTPTENPDSPGLVVGCRANNTSLYKHYILKFNFVRCLIITERLEYDLTRVNGVTKLSLQNNIIHMHQLHRRVRFKIKFKIVSLKMFKTACIINNKFLWFYLLLEIRY